MKLNLLRLLEWHAQCTSKAPVNTWQLGRRINVWAAEKVTETLSGIWGAWESQSLWEALFVQLTLFRRLTIELAQALAYQYDDETHQEINNYIRRLHRQDRDAQIRG